MLALQCHLAEGALACKQQGEQGHHHCQHAQSDSALLQRRIGLYPVHNPPVNHQPQQRGRRDCQEGPDHGEIVPDGLQHGGRVVLKQTENNRIDRGFVKPEIVQVDEPEKHIEADQPGYQPPVHRARHPGEHQQQQKAGNRADLEVEAEALHRHGGKVAATGLVALRPKIRQLPPPDHTQSHHQWHDEHPGAHQAAQDAVECGCQGTGNGMFHSPYIVSANSSRPMSMRRISLVPAPISYNLASRHKRPSGYSLM